MNILLTIGYTIIFILFIQKFSFFRIEGLNGRALSAIMLIKVASGICMSMIYIYYYTDRVTADIYKYYDDSKIMYDALFTHPIDYLQMVTGIGNNSPHFDVYYIQMNNWYRIYESNIYNDSHTIIRFNAVVRLFSFGCYNVHTAFMCFFSLIGLTGIYKFFVNHLPDKRKSLFVAVFLMPSVIFWGSGVLKEGLLLFGLGLLLYFTDKIFRKRFSFISLVLIILSLCLLMFLKFYILITVLFLFITYLYINKTNERFVMIKYLLTLLVFFLIGLNIHYVFPEYNVLDILVNKQQDFIRLTNAMNSGSNIKIGLLEPNVWSFICHAPEALFNTLFRPFFFESLSPFILFAGIENLFIIFVMLFCFIFINTKTINKNLFWFCFFFVLITFTLTGLVTPVMGAIVRYKIPALPFFMVMLLLLFDKNKFFKTFSFLKRFL